jgi:arylformamidase
MTKIDYESEYDNRARVPEHRRIFAQWERDAAAYRAGITDARRLTMSYGNTARQTIDIFLAECGPDAPLAVFIHGGWWRSFQPALFSHMAAGLNARGISVAVPGYDLCPQVGIADIIAQMRAALLLLWRTYAKRMLVYGHSAGGHLTAAMMATDWPALAPGTPADLVPAGYAISGVFDLLPLTQVSMNADFRLDPAGAKAVSPLYWPAPRGFALDAVMGALESGEFLRQSRAIADAWGKAGVATRYEEVTGTNHFTVIGPLADPNSAMVARLVALTARLG